MGKAAPDFRSPHRLDPVTADRRTTPHDTDDADKQQIVSLQTYCRGSLLIDALTIAMAEFEAATLQMHQHDPDTFPLTRSEADWWREFRAWVSYEHYKQTNALTEEMVSKILES